MGPNMSPTKAQHRTYGFIGPSELTLRCGRLSSRSNQNTGSGWTKMNQLNCPSRFYKYGSQTSPKTHIEKWRSCCSSHVLWGSRPSLYSSPLSLVHFGIGGMWVEFDSIKQRRNKFIKRYADAMPKKVRNWLQNIVSFVADTQAVCIQHENLTSYLFRLLISTISPWFFANTYIYICVCVCACMHACIHFFAGAMSLINTPSNMTAAKNAQRQVGTII